MSTAISVLNQNLPQFTPEQMKLITDTVAKGATPDELKLFLYRCQHLGLDPLKPGQIYFIKYGTGPGTIVVGIEGFRARAAKTGKLSGIKRGAVRSESGELIGAYAEVYRSDWNHCAREEVPLAEYNTGKGNWAKMPETMIKKVAEAAALRMAFPDDLGGTYIKEEMDQAEQQKKPWMEQPTQKDGVLVAPKASMITDGTYARKDVKELTLDELKHKRQILEDKSNITTEELQTLEQVINMIEAHEQIEPQEESSNICDCGKTMMESKWANKVTGARDWYCSPCKKGRARYL